MQNDDYKQKLRESIRKKMGYKNSNTQPTNNTVAEDVNKESLVKKADILINGNMVQGWNVRAKPPALPDEKLQIQCLFCGEDLKFNADTKQIKIDYCRRFRMCLLCELKNTGPGGRVDRTVPKLMIDRKLKPVE